MDMHPVVLAQTVLALVIATRGVESGTLAATRRRGAQLFRRQRWRLAARLLEATAGVSMVDWTLVAVDIWPWAAAGPGFRAGPRGARLTAEAAWYAVSERLGPQLAALAFSPLVRSMWWLEIRLELEAEELFGILLLGNRARYAYRRLAVEVPEAHRWGEAAGHDSDEILSVASHGSTSDLFGSEDEVVSIRSD